MIPLNEIRYGNLVHNKDKKEIRINDISDIVMIGQNNEKYYGIPITEEYLLKFGAVKYKEYSFYFDLKDTLKLFFNIGDDYFICELVSNSSHVCYLNHIKNVHQLQNLYFALTGNELIINN